MPSTRLPHPEERTKGASRRTQNLNAPAANSLRGGGDLVLGLGLEIAGVVPLEQLLRRLAGRAVDHAPALHRRGRPDLLGPANAIFVFVRADDLGPAILPELHQAAIPRPDRHVGDR